jgi:hypothetical protein
MTMDRAAVYSVLAVELEGWRRLPYDELRSRVDDPPQVRTVTLGSEVIDVEVRLYWADQRRGSIRVEAVANGPSCWRLERLMEAITLTAPTGRDRS